MRDNMAKCYICEKEIADENKSKEHILLNALGGRLKSYGLLCKNCNSDLGNDMDVELAEQFHPFMVFLNIKRDREKLTPYSTKRKDNDEDILIYPGGKPKLRHPIIKHGGDGKIYLVVSDDKMANLKYKEIKKKYPNAVIESKEYKKEYITANIHLEFNDYTFLSLFKTAIGYYLYSGGERKHIQKFISSFKKRDINGKCNYFYPEVSVVNKAEVFITHTILIIGNPQEKILYCYIELFNFFKCLFIMNDDYEGPSINKAYCYDLLGEKEIRVYTTLNLSRQELLEYIKNDPPKHIEPMIKEYKEFLSLMKYWNITNKVCDRVSQDLNSLHEGSSSSDLFIKYSIEEMMKMGIIKR